MESFHFPFNKCLTWSYFTVKALGVGSVWRQGPDHVDYCGGISAVSCCSAAWYKEVDNKHLEGWGGFMCTLGSFLISYMWRSLKLEKQLVYFSCLFTTGGSLEPEGYTYGYCLIGFVISSVVRWYTYRCIAGWRMHPERCNPATYFANTVQWKQRLSFFRCRK